MQKYSFKFISMLVLSSLLVSGNSLAEEEFYTKDEVFNLEIERKAREDTTNFHYYPKIGLGQPNLFGGAATLKQNEVFARLFVSGIINRGFINAAGQSTTGGLPTYLQGGLQLGWGILDNLLFTASVPARYFLSGSPNLSDPWINLKYRIIESPFILSVQAEGKIPVGNANISPAFGSGNLDAGGMLLATKSFEPLFIQAGVGYRYRNSYQIVQNNALTSGKYADQLNYVVNFGWNFKTVGMMVDISAYGYYPLGSGTTSYNFVTVKPNLTYKFMNNEANLSVDVPLFGLNIDNPISINAGFTFKNSFEYPKFFTLMFSRKIDAETIEKKKDFSQVVRGKELYLNTCSKCHALVDPDIKTFEEWEPIVDRYRTNKVLTKPEHSAIIEFLRVYRDTDTTESVVDSN